MKLKKIIKLFEDGNVCVTGLRGRGKDVLFGNVIARRKLPYISNTYYCPGLIPFKSSDIDLAGNDYKSFISGRTTHYEFPFSDGTDLYLADAGVYFPAQYNNQLDRDFQGMSGFQALSRHLGKCNFHVNVQNLNRVWLKIREQSDTYIRCDFCKILFGFCLMKVTIYDQYEACVHRVEPFRVRVPLLANQQVKTSVDIARSQYQQVNGSVRSAVLFFRNKSKHRSRVFRDILLEDTKGVTDR